MTAVINASTFRHLRGDTKPVTVKPATGEKIEVGDLVYLDPTTNTVKRASSMIDQGSLALNQDAFQQYFLGVALQKSGLETNETSFNLTTTQTYIEVATAGEFLFDCASYAWSLGELVAAVENSDGDALRNQNVVAVSATSYSKAIGVAVPFGPCLGVAKTQVAVRIKSTIMDFGVQAQVAGSSSGAI